MPMQTTAIRFAPEEREWIQAYADFVGSSFSDVVREAVLEKIEEEADVAAYEEFLREDDGVRYTMDEVKRMLFADDDEQAEL